MNRLMMLAVAATLLGVGGNYLIDPPVNLQAVTPGTKQTGNINVSGTILGGNVFASTSGASAKAVSGFATSPSGYVFGGDFRSSSTNGRGIFASATAPAGVTYGGDFRTASVDGRGVFGFATATSGQGIGGEFRSASLSGNALIATTTSTSGTNITAKFDNASYNGTALQAIVSSSDGAPIAGSFKVMSKGNTAIGLNVDGNKGYGLRVFADGLTGIGATFDADAVAVGGYSKKSYGIYGYSDNVDAYGTAGHLAAGGTGHALYASGTFAASGTKALEIDHPDDPENKMLRQYCAEGDTPQLQYRGMVVLDSTGRATIQLPHYFDQINRDPTYQLTAIGAPMPSLYVSQEGKNNAFSIAGGKAGAKVSWTVIGIRNDRFGQKYGAATEIEKADENKGTYLMPDLYNQPKQRGQSYNPKLDLDVRSDQPQASQQRRNSNASKK